jgi:fatty-acyl-CoA synthase
MTSTGGDASHGLTGRVVRLRRWIGVAAVVCAVAAPLLALLGAIGSKSGWFDIHVGFDWMAVRIAPALAIVGAALGALALIGALVPPRGGVAVALIAIALGSVVAGTSAWWRAAAVRNPPVHDTATDWSDPLLFSPNLMIARGANTNPIESDPLVPYSRFTALLAGQRVAVVNAKTCPAATPVTLTLPPDQAYARLKTAALRAGLKLVTADPAPDSSGRRRLEGTATGFWFGFKDDLAARVSAAGAGTRIDLRVSSRIGLTDFGRGCRLITRLRGMVGR